MLSEIVSKRIDGSSGPDSWYIYMKKRMGVNKKTNEW